MVTKPSTGRRACNAAEWDLRWKRYYCYLSNHSGSAKVKRAARRRDRRHESRALRKEPRDE